MAQTDTNWQRAEEALDHIDLVRQTLATRLSRLGDRIARLFRERRPSSTVGAEERALSFQIRMARDFIALRREARLKLLAKPDWPEKEPIPLVPAEAPNSVVKSLLGLISEIRKADIPPKAKEDMLADYWNKWAFITWERGLREDSASERTQWFAYVERYLDLIHEEQGRDFWTPWQINRVRLLLGQSLGDGDHENALLNAQNMLNRILGTGPAPVAAPPAPTVDIETIADKVADWASDHDPIAAASNMRRAYPGLSQESLGQITAALARRVSAPLLDQILKQYSSCQ